MIYLLPGLGANHYDVDDFVQYLPVPVKILDLPGHGRNFDRSLTSQEDLKSWFGCQMDWSEEVILLGHSLGADLALILATSFPQISKVILLEGGFLDMEKICSLDEELAGIDAHFHACRYSDLQEAVAEEKSQSRIWSSQMEHAAKERYTWNPQQSCYELALNPSTIKQLLRIRRQAGLSLTDLQDREVLLILSDMGVSTPYWRREAERSIPNFVRLEKIPQAGHLIYQDQPKVVAGKMMDFLL